MELQQTLMQHNKVKHQTDGRIQLNERAKRRDQLTIAELKQLPSSTRTFSSVGRMFVQQRNKKKNFFLHFFSSGLLLDQEVKLTMI